MEDGHGVFIIEFRRHVKTKKVAENMNVLEESWTLSVDSARLMKGGQSHGMAHN